MQGYFVYFKGDDLLFCNVPEETDIKDIEEIQDAINKLDDNHVIVIDL